MWLFLIAFGFPTNFGNMKEKIINYLVPTGINNNVLEKDR
jgi:hypothetical protein